MNDRIAKIVKKDNFLSNIILLIYAFAILINHDKDKDIFTVISYYDKKVSFNLVKELLWSRYVAGCVYQQYFQFGFENKRKKERLAYIGSYEMHEFIMQSGSKKTIDLMEDKYETYLKYKDYYKRNVIKVSSQQDIIEFSKFIQDNKKFIIKPIGKYGGKNIKICNIEQESPKSIFAKLLSMGGSVCEELINQCDDMACYHPSSVNTIRIVTYFENNKLSIVFAILRIGTGNSSVDNTSSGGIAAAIDIETGRVISDGLVKMDKKLASYSKHPDTNIQINGSVIPKWKDLISMLDGLVRVLPEQKYIGWDMALTNDGWVMVEANPKPLISTIQILEQKGYREKIENLKK